MLINRSLCSLRLNPFKLGEVIALDLNIKIAIFFKLAQNQRMNNSIFQDQQMWHLIGCVAFVWSHISTKTHVNYQIKEKE